MAINNRVGPDVSLTPMQLLLNNFGDDTAIAGLIRASHVSNPQNNESPLARAKAVADFNKEFFKQRKPLVFEWKHTSKVPSKPYKVDGDEINAEGWRTITLYINPQRLEFSSSKIKSKQITRRGIFWHHWDEDAGTLTLTGTTGLSGMAGIEQLEKAYLASGTLLNYEDYERRSTLVELRDENGGIDAYPIIDWRSPLDLITAAINGGQSIKVERATGAPAISIYTNRALSDISESMVQLYKSTKELDEFSSQMGFVDQDLATWVETFKNKNNRYPTPNEYYDKARSLIIGYVSSFRLDYRAETAYKEINDEYEKNIASINPNSPLQDQIATANAYKAIKDAKLRERVYIFKQDYWDKTIEYCQRNNKKLQDLKVEDLNTIFGNLDPNSKNIDLSRWIIVDTIITNNVPYNNDFNQFINLTALHKTLEYAVSQGLDILTFLNSSTNPEFKKVAESFKSEVDEYKTSLKISGTDPTVKVEELRQARIKTFNAFQDILQEWRKREEQFKKKLYDVASNALLNEFNDRWLPRRILCYFEDRVYVGHFDSFSYSRVADTPLINYSLRFTVEYQYLAHASTNYEAFGGLTQNRFPTINVTNT